MEREHIFSNKYFVPLNPVILNSQEKKKQLKEKSKGKGFEFKITENFK